MLTTNKIKFTNASKSDNYKRIKLIENMLQTEIPEGLKQLLLNYDKVQFEKNSFTRVVDTSFSQGMTLESILGTADILTAHSNMEDEDELKKNHLLIFGETLGSPIICIGTGKKNYNMIYVFDYDFGLTEIANSFSGFIKSLQ